VHLLNLTTGKDALGRAGHTASIRGVGFSGNQKLRSLSSEEVCEWEPATGKLLSRHFLAALADLPFPILALGPSGRLFAIKAWEKELGLLDVATGKVSWSPLAVKHLPRLSKFTPDGKRAVFIDEELPTDDWVRVWDLLRNTEVRKFPMHGNQITCVAISHDGKRVASGHNDPLVLVWDVTTGKRLFRLPCGTGGSDAHELALSSDGALLAAACRDKVIRLWDLNSGKELHHLAGYRREGFVPCLIFAPDNRSIVLGGRASGTVQIWEVCTGRERCHFDGHRARVWCLAWSPNGRLLASGSDDTTLLVWDVTGTAISSGRPAELTREQLASLWDDLASPDAARAYHSMKKLAASPRQATTFLAERLRPARPVPRDRTASLLARLDSRQFAERERAVKELERLGLSAEVALFNARADPPSLEVRQRIDRLLVRLDGAPKWQALRALEVLEWLGTPDVRAALRELAEGDDSSTLTRQAKASLARLQRGAGD